MKFTLRREGEDRGWPNYLFWGRVRTSTFCLIVAFALTWWLYDTYQPPPQAPTDPAQVVPPGFVPDPEYTWVPRTNVRTAAPTPTTTTTTTPTTETPTPIETPTNTPAVPAIPWLPATPASPSPGTPAQPTPTPAPTPGPPGLLPGLAPAPQQGLQ
jgi:hypothetical protein